MDIRFELPSIKYKEEAILYIKEFNQYKSDIFGTGGLDIENYENWLENTLLSHEGKEARSNYVSASTYFVFDEDILVGMINIRHHLNDYLINSGSGHIGYSVRPTQRKKGYATKILKKGLEILKNDYNVDTAMLGCYKFNKASMKTILNNGGVLDKEIIEDDNLVTLVFLINLK